MMFDDLRPAEIAAQRYDRDEAGGHGDQGSEEGTADSGAERGEEGEEGEAACDWVQDVHACEVSAPWWNCVPSMLLIIWAGL